MTVEDLNNLDLEVAVKKLGGSNDSGPLIVDNTVPNSSGSRRPTATTRSPIQMPALFDTKVKKALWGCLAFAVVLTGVCLVGVSLKKVDSTEFGLEYNVHNKQLDDIAKAGGLHVGVS